MDQSRFARVRTCDPHTCTTRTKVRVYGRRRPRRRSEETIEFGSNNAVSRSPDPEATGVAISAPDDGSRNHTPAFSKTLRWLLQAVWFQRLSLTIGTMSKGTRRLTASHNMLWT